MRWYFLLHESLQSAYRTVILNKLRTLLSLLGVTIGIFSIVCVFCVDLMKGILENPGFFGTDIVARENGLAPEEGN
jgi:putative ABC transport system permease protein